MKALFFVRVLPVSLSLHLLTRSSGAAHGSHKVAKQPIVDIRSVKKEFDPFRTLWVSELVEGKRRENLYRKTKGTIMSYYELQHLVSEGRAGSVEYGPDKISGAWDLMESYGLYEADLTLLTERTGLAERISIIEKYYIEIYSTFHDEARYYRLRNI